MLVSLASPLLRLSGRFQMRFCEPLQAACSASWPRWRRHSSQGHKAGTLAVLDAVVSGRRVSFKLPGWLSRSRVGSSGSCESRFRQNTAREGMGAACSQRVMVPGRRFQAMRPSVSRPGRAKSQAQRVRTLLVYVPAALWECWNRCRFTSGHPLQGRPTPKLAGD